MDEIKKNTRERRRERTRTFILETAEQILAEGGLQKLTLAELAHRADYSKPAIYEYFGGIDDILIEIGNAGFVRLGQQLQAVPDTLPPDERLRAIGHAYMQFAADNVELYQLMFTHIIFSPGRFDQRWAEARGDTQLSFRLASQVIQQGIDQGIFKTRPGFDRNAMVYASWVVIHGMASLKSSLVREVGLAMPHHRNLMLTLLINNLKGLMPDELPVKVF